MHARAVLQIFDSFGIGGCAIIPRRPATSSVESSRGLSSSKSVESSRGLSVGSRVLQTALVAVLVSGCVTFDPNAGIPPLPDRHDVFLDQLVVHSNFELPGQHRLLQELNAQRTDLSSKLALPISDEPVHVYLFADAERFGQFMQRRYPNFPQRRAFFVETDTKLAVYAHWGDRVAEDLRHEVAHGYLHAVVQNLPLWLDEGLAEYFESASRKSRLESRAH